MRVLIYLSVFCSLFACEKFKIKDGEKHLPRATEKGRGIFACYIDDHTYIARRQDEVSYNKSSGYFFLENSNDQFEFRLFVFQGLFSEGNYKFDVTGEDYLKHSGEYYGIDSSGINLLEITKLDVKERIIAGLFELDLVSASGKRKKIRNGRFDLEMEIFM